MGGAASSTSTVAKKTIKSAPVVQRISIQVSPHISSASSEIDVNTVFSALLKLACIFDLKDSLTTSLTNEIVDPKHANIDAQFVAVEEWINKHGAGMNVKLTADEMDYLIQYVELYRPIPVEAEAEDHALSIPRSMSYAESEVTETSRRSRPLVCPFRCELAGLTGDIRTQEAKRIHPSWHSPVENTVSMRFSSQASGSSSRLYSLRDSNDEEGSFYDMGGELRWKPVRVNRDL